MMKTMKLILVLTTWLGASLCAGAASLAFDADTATAGAQDGSGIWTNGVPDTNWWNGAANTNWSSAPADSAVFGAGSGAAGVVSVADTVTVAGVTFNAAGSGTYVVTNGQINLTGTPAFQMNVNGQIASTLSGGGTMLVQGPGTLTLNGSHLFTGNLRVTNGTLNFGGQALSLGTLSLLGTNMGTANILPGSALRVSGGLLLGDADGGSGTINQSGGEVYYQGVTNNFRVAHWPRETSTYNLSGGLVQALTNRVMFVGWDGVAHFNQSGGTAQLYGMQVGGGDSQTRTNIATFNLTGGRIELGAGGLRSRTNAAQVNLGGGTVGASANWASAVPLRFNGTNGNTSFDVPAATTITLSGILTGTGGVNKTGAGTLLLATSANPFTGGIIISNGIVAGGGDSANNQNDAAFGPAPIRVLTNGQLRLGGNAGGLVHHYVTNHITLDGGTIFSIDGAQHLTNSTITVGSGGGTLLARYGTKDLFVESPVSGTAPLTVNNGGGGSGTPVVWFMNNNNPYGGTVTVAAATALLGVGRPNVLTNATVNLGGSNAVTFGALTGGTATFGKLTGGGAMVLPTNTLMVGSLGVDSSYDGQLSGAGSLTKIGPGVLTLNGPSVLTGSLRVNAGTLALGASGSANSAAIVVNSGGTFDVTAFSPYAVPATQLISGNGTVTGTVTATDSARVVGGGLGTPGTLTLANDFITTATYTNGFDLTNSLTIGAGVNDLLVVNGDASSAGSTIAVNPLAPLVSGTYRLMNYGAMSFTSFNAVVAGNTSRDSWTLDTATFGEVNLIVMAGTPNFLTWTGPGADWDGGNINWFSLTTTAPDRFYDLDTVLFDDAGATVNVVTVSGTVKPTAVLVNSASNYTLQGAGSVADYAGVPATLAKDGTGMLTIQMTNSFSGGSSIAAGSVLLGDASGRSLGVGPVTNDAALLFNNSDTYALANDVTGSGTMAKDGSGTVTLTGTNSFTGNIAISGGTLAVGGAGSLGNYPGAISNDGQFIYSSTTNSTLAGAISGTGSLVFAGTGTATLSGTNDYTGGIHVTGYLSLSTSNGVSIPGMLTNQGWIFIGSPANQFAANTVMYFPTNGVPTGPSFGVLELDGFNQTVAGLVGGNSSWGYIEAAQIRGAGTTGILTIATAPTEGYVYSGYSRNQGGIFGITKTGLGTQTLAGAGNTYSGPTMVNEGRLIFHQGGYGSTSINIASNAVLELSVTNGTVDYATSTIRGTGTLVKTGAGNARWGTQAGTFALNDGSLIDVQAGTFIGGSSANENWSANRSSLNVASGASIVEMAYLPSQFDALTGGGLVAANANAGAGPHTFTIGINNTAAGTYNSAGTATFSGIISNGGNLVKVGTGTQIFTGNNAYTGSTTVTGGTLALGTGGSISNSPRIIVGAGAAFDVSVIGNYALANFQSLEGSGLVTGGIQAATASRVVPGAPGAVGTLTLGNELFLSSTTTNAFDLNATNQSVGGGVNDLVEIGFAFEPSNAVVSVGVVGGPALTNGTYRLVNYAGSKLTTFNSNVVGNITRKTLTLDEATAGQVNLIVSGGLDAIRWNPLVSTNWNTTDANWQDIVGLTNTTFFAGDNVLFDDVGLFSNNVYLASALMPQSLTVNSTGNYAFTGAGKISDTTGILKDGPGMLSIGGTANDYSGPVTISNGILRTLVSTALGSTSGATTISGNGTLDVNGLNLGQELVLISGAGFGGNGAIVNSGASQVNALQYVRLIGDASVGGNNGNRWDIRAGTAPYLDLNGFTLTKVGTNFVGLVGTVTTNAGDIIINAGQLGLHTSPTIVTGPGSIYVNPAGSLDINVSPVIQKTVVLNGGTLSVSAAGTIGPQIIVNTNSTIATTSGALGLTNVISGAGGLVKTNANTLNLTADNTYSGGTTVAGGELQIGNNTASGSIVGWITNNANLYYFRTNDFTVMNPITGSGNVHIRTLGGTTTFDSNSPVFIRGQFIVGSSFNARLILTNGASITTSNTINFAANGSAYVTMYPGAKLTTLTNNLDIGNTANNILYFGDVTQYGGDVNIAGGGSEPGIRIGHYPTEVSIYRMLGGTITTTNNNSKIWLGIDGIGILDIKGGTVKARQLDVDGRASTGATLGTNETLILEGGNLILGNGGLQTGTGGASGNVFLGGGILSAYTDWTSGAAGLNTQITGTNGNTILDSAGFTYRLAMVMSGTGGLTKAGAGTVALSAYNTYSGDTVVNGGTLVLSNTVNNGSSVIGTSKLTINPGATVRTYVNSFGHPVGNGPHNSIVINGGTLTQGNFDSHLRDVTMTEGTITGTEYRPHWDITSFAATNPSLIASTLGLQSNITFIVADGAATNDLLVTGAVNGTPGFNKAGPGRMTMEGNGAIAGNVVVSNGTLILNGDLTAAPLVSVESGATLGGTGNCNNVANSGTFAPGASVGQFILDNNYTQLPSGTYHAELAGAAAPGTDYDLAIIVGTADLAGALVVTNISGFVPAYGDTFQILTAGGGINGTFTTTNLPALPVTNIWTVDYTSPFVTLSITSAPTAPTGYNAFSNTYVLINGPEGDDDADGFANLYEYVTGSNPTNGSSANALAAARSNGLFALKFLRDTNTVDATLIVEGSYASTNDAEWIGFATNISGSWGSATNVIEGASSPAAVTAFDIAPAATNRFLRLRITRP